MNCANCGAPLVLVGNRDYFYCEYCGAFHFPPEAEEGVCILNELPDGLYCPVCKVPMFLASLEGNRVMYCQNCRGILAPQLTFGEVVKERRGRAAKPPEKARPINPGELQRRLRCPSCGEFMETHPYLGPGNVVIDTCGACHVLWLDAGELTTIENAPGRDRGGKLYVDQLEHDEESWLYKKLKKDHK